MNFEPQIIEVGLEEIIPNRFQPRLTFDEKAMQELSASIKEHGIIQPLVLRRVGDKYEIIAGERRYKAAGMAGLQKVPAIITNLDDNSSAEVALVENVQRKGLTPIEEAKSYKVLLDRGYVTQDELAKKIGVSQSTVANKLRLLNLDEEVQKALLDGNISERHARSLLQLPDKNKQKELLQKIIAKRLTVRQLDDEIKNLNKSENKMDDTPLVDIAPSVDEIKNNASDINPPKLSPGIEEMLKTEAEVKSETEIPVINPNVQAPSIGSPVTEQPVVPSMTEEPKPEEPAQNKFFNFLEDEEANMNMANKPIVSEAPVVNTEPKEVEVLDITPPAIPNNENIVDPVSKIETLAPDYVPPKTEEEQEDKFDLTDAINLLRDTTKQIEEKGLVVDTEEIDLENLYQIIIKIDKNTE
ncbi:MAG TPA: ParB/RepB/Spo0J family partition protein [Bacilli bacterium]|nr:ParB/RepB/Spo0J family partition protein [Bacilli bacterium]